jgi:hypothetical protein
MRIDFGMKYSELLHVLRASAAISQEQSFVLIGSQAVLLLLENPPDGLLRSTEIDLYPSSRPEKAELIDGAIGAMSSFHETFGYHADGVSPETASLPKDWMSRSVFRYLGDITAICPDIHDLAVSKCAAGREKDADYIRVLLQERLIDASVLLERVEQLDGAKHDKTRLANWVHRRAQEAGVE